MNRVSKQQKWILAATVLFVALIFSATMHRADATRVTTVSPQGKVAQMRQVVVRFDEAMTDFGDPNAAAPGKVFM